MISSRAGRDSQWSEVSEAIRNRSAYVIEGDTDFKTRNLLEGALVLTGSD